MFCNSCGAPNPDGAAFCSSCGASLSKAAAPVQPQTVPVSSPGTSGDKKNPFVAAILNLFFGVGYLYLGYKKVFGLSTIVFVIVAFIVQIVIGIFTFGILSFLFALLLAYDGYVKADGKKGYIGTEPAMLYQS